LGTAATAAGNPILAGPILAAGLCIDSPDRRGHVAVAAHLRDLWRFGVAMQHFSLCASREKEHNDATNLSLSFFPSRDLN